MVFRQTTKNCFTVRTAPTPSTPSRRRWPPWPAGLQTCACALRSARVDRSPCCIGSSVVGSTADTPATMSYERRQTYCLGREPWAVYTHSKYAGSRTPQTPSAGRCEILIKVRIIKSIQITETHRPTTPRPVLPRSVLDQGGKSGTLSGSERGGRFKRCR